MLHEFHIFHWDKSKSKIPPQGIADGSSFYFETCLRFLQISTSEIPVDWKGYNPTESFRGERAYSWLLEILAGLHSPLVGETEVLGQFRDQVIFPLGSSVPSLLKGIVEDVKKIRHECLQNLGQKTYGSLARRLMLGERPLYFLGAGQMTREILPFMQKMNRKKVKVVARNLERAKKNFPYLPDLQGWDEIIEDEDFDLIIAAPISDEKLQSWVQNQPGLIKRCLDLRAVSTNNHQKEVAPMAQEGFWNLTDFFNLKKNEESMASSKITVAKQKIKEVAEKRWLQRWDRPFGWEDVCA